MVFLAMPPDDQSRYVLPLIRCKPEAPLHVVHLSPMWVGLGVHWNGRSNVICSGESTCSFCRSTRPQWQGFVVVRRATDSARALLQITPNVVEALLRRRDKERGLCGVTGIYSRCGVRNNSPLMFTYHGTSMKETPISPQELKGHVARIFRMSVKPS